MHVNCIKAYHKQQPTKEPELDKEDMFNYEEEMVVDQSVLGEEERELHEDSEEDGEEEREESENEKELNSVGMKWMGKVCEVWKRVNWKNRNWMFDIVNTKKQRNSQVDVEGEELGGARKKRSKEIDDNSSI